MKKLLGFIVLSLLYFGNAYAECKEGNCSNGTGTMVWPNGDQYVGEWKDGKIHGVGTLTWSDGTKYAGDWKNGIEDGIGTLTWPNGDQYVGERKDSKASGQGTMILNTGVKYVATWIEDKKYGLGKKFYNDKLLYEGRWENDILVEKNGKAIELSVNDLWYAKGWTDKLKIKYKYIFKSDISVPKIIKKKDLTTFKELKFIKKAENIYFYDRVGKEVIVRTEVPFYDNKIEEVLGGVYIFEAIYEENYGHNVIRFMVNTDFKSLKKAEKVALKYARYMGQLPAFLKGKNLRDIYIHPKDKKWFATESKNQFTIYNRDIKPTRIIKSLIHEAAHVATDISLLKDPLWKKAWDADKKHITDYARTNKYEDAAETVVFWIGLRCGKKVPNNFKKKIIAGIPNRIKYLDEQGYDTYPLVCS